MERFDTVMGMITMVGDRTPHVLASLLLLTTLALAGCASERNTSVQLVHHEQAQRVDVLVDGEPFTSYLYGDLSPVLRKPVLFPVRAPGGAPVTRGYPIEPLPGERTDHPHQIGFWFTYGNVNGLDFWNNSGAVSPERALVMGTIRHRSIDHMESSRGEGALVVAAEWLDAGKNALLHETTRFVFHASPEMRIIDRTTTLTAGDADVSFEDDKEGMLGLRVARAFEVPSDSRVSVVGPDGGVVESSAADGATGAYLNSDGVSGYPDVWGRRARWMTLSGMLEDGPVTVALLDHPSNPGHPTYWHARDYGLFSANPLGQADFSDGAERLDFSLRAGASTTFRYRLVISSGEARPADVEGWYDTFTVAD